MECSLLLTPRPLLRPDPSGPSLSLRGTRAEQKPATQFSLLILPRVRPALTLQSLTQRLRERGRRCCQHCADTQT